MQLSSDLVHWSDPSLVVEVNMSGGCADSAGPDVLDPMEVIFPSFIDHDDATVKFERIGQTSYLYYVRFKSGVIVRDIVRVPVTFTRRD